MAGRARCRHAPREFPNSLTGSAKRCSRISPTTKSTAPDIVFNQWRPAEGVHVERRRLFPLDLALFKTASEAPAPLTYLKLETLLAELTFAYMHAQLCNAALHAFAAENEARMEAMARAHGEVERNLNSLLSTQRIVRQEEITAEIVELSAGVAATAGFASHSS